MTGYTVIDPLLPTSLSTLADNGQKLYKVDCAKAE